MTVYAAVTEITYEFMCDAFRGQSNQSAGNLGEWQQKEETSQGPSQH